MLRRTEGIVMKTVPYGEADLIVTFLTADYGILKAFAKSPRKTKSRFGSSLEPLTHSNISFWGREDASLPKLTQADIIDPFQKLRSDLRCFLKVSEIIEITLNFVPERDATSGVFPVLLDALRQLELKCDASLILLSYKLKLLKRAGFLPRLSGCGRCGKISDSFFLAHGTVLCLKCSKGIESSRKLSAGAVKLHSSLLEWDFSKLGRIMASEKLALELGFIIDEHVRHISEREVRSSNFYSNKADTPSSSAN